MNKVTLNGKIPPKRVNLKSVDTAIWHKNFLPEKFKRILFNEDEKIIAIGVSNKIWEGGFDDPWTQTGVLDSSYTDCECFFIQDGKQYMIFQKLFQTSLSTIAKIGIFKFENGNLTLISETDVSTLGANRYDSIIYTKKDTLYLYISDTKCYKSKDLGKTWTNIYKNIRNNTDTTLSTLFSLAEKYSVNIDDIMYIFTSEKIYKFDGITFSIYKENIGIRFQKGTSDFTSRNTVYILDVKELYSITTSKELMCTFYKIEKDLDDIKIKKEKSFTSYMTTISFVNKKKLTCYSVEIGDETGLCYKEFPVRAYIEK